MNRRAFMASLALLGVSGKVLASLAEQPDLFFSAQGAQKAQFGFASVNGQVHQGLTGFRGHGATQHPIDLHRVVMFARRPGHFGVEIDLRSGLVVNRFDAQPQRHFLGMGVSVQMVVCFITLRWI